MKTLFRVVASGKGVKRTFQLRLPIDGIVCLKEGPFFSAIFCFFLIFPISSHALQRLSMIITSTVADWGQVDFESSDGFFASTGSLP
jgi:hypothetical protein